MSKLLLHKVLAMTKSKHRIKCSPLYFAYEVSGLLVFVAGKIIYESQNFDGSLCV